MTERAPRKPPRLQPGMTIGVVAPSSPLRDDRLEQGIRVIEERGYRVERGAHLSDRHGYLAGADSARAADLSAMFARADVDAVFCARGGYGAVRILPHVDWRAVSTNAKLFVGYSDVTTLHLALEERAGFVTVHGPMVVTLGGGLSEPAAECFWTLLEKPDAPGLLDARHAEVRTLVPGFAAGRLTGGCLSLLAAAVGAPEQPDWTGRIALIEDVGEVVYRIDRYLAQLARAGILQQAAGFVIGCVTDWEKQEKEPPEITPDSLWQEYIAPLGKPAIVGFPFGHAPNPLTLPLGCLAELNASSCELSVVEAAVR